MNTVTLLEMVHEYGDPSGLPGDPEVPGPRRLLAGLRPRGGEDQEGARACFRSARRFSVSIGFYSRGF